MTQPPAVDAAFVPTSDYSTAVFAQQALAFSVDLNAAYLQDHLEQSEGLTAAAAASLAVARLQWILQSTRRELSGLFDEEEIATLVNCYKGEVFFPDQFNSLASDLCDDLGIDLDDAEESGAAKLVKKLRGLTPSQRATLADALEQAWHNGMRYGYSPKVVFASLGIALG